MKHKVQDALVALLRLPLDEQEVAAAAVLEIAARNRLGRDVEVIAF